MIFLSIFTWRNCRFHSKPKAVLSIQLTIIFLILSSLAGAQTGSGVMRDAAKRKQQAALARSAEATLAAETAAKIATDKAAADAQAAEDAKQAQNREALARVQAAKEAQIAQAAEVARLAALQQATAKQKAAAANLAAADATRKTAAVLAAKNSVATPVEKRVATITQESQVLVRFQPAGNGVIRDVQAKLEWMQADNGKDISWADAANFCASQNWALPSQNQLKTMFVPGAKLTTPCGPVLCKTSPLFKLTSPYGFYWSNEASGAHEARYIALDFGTAYSSPRGNAMDLRALCVRKL
jgi:hypothetical protein